MKKKNKSKLFVALLFLYLFIPLLAIFIFSIAGKWEQTPLPETLTMKYYKLILSDPDFWNSMIRSLVISIAASVGSMILIVPCIYLTTTYYRRLERLFELLALIPFVMPGVVLAIGLIQMFSGLPVDITGTVWILLGAYFILCYPFIYQAVKSSFRAINSKCLAEAAKVLGCNEMQAFVRVILPNIAKGLLSSLLLGISVLFGEFVLVNLLVGSQYKTVQIYLFNALNTDGHTTSAIVSVYIMFIFIISALAAQLTNKSLHGRKISSKSSYELSQERRQDAFGEDSR